MMQGGFYKVVFVIFIFPWLWYAIDYPSVSNPDKYSSTIGQTSSRQNQGDHLFISEYVEGSSNNKCLEFFNPGSTRLSLSDYSVRFYFNGQTSPGKIFGLAGWLNSQQTYVVCDDDAAPVLLNLADTSLSGTFYNGDDVIILFYKSDTIDVIGRLGEDPGSQWGSGLTSTANNTLIRKPNINKGDTLANDHFDPFEEWLGFAQDHFSDLGQHTFLPPVICDSIFTLIEVQICQGETVLFQDSLLGHSGTFIDTLLTHEGCDSVLTLTLTVADTTVLHQIADTICSNGPYFVNLLPYQSTITTEPGTFSYEVKNFHRGQDLFISEYIEGSGSNKCIEIFNPTPVPIILEEDDTELIFYFNGSTDPGRRIRLTGSIDPYMTFVLCHENADHLAANIADTLLGGSFYNGDDVVLLARGTTIIDVIGRIGEDPGNQWGTGLVSTQNNTLVRRVDIVIGDTEPNDVFDPMSEWQGFESDNFNDLGKHQFLPPLICREVENSEAVEIQDGDWVAVEFLDSATNCRSGSEIHFVFHRIPDIYSNGRHNTCPDLEVDLRTVEFVDRNHVPGEADTTYYLTAIDAIHGTNALNSPVISQSGLYFIRYEVENCFDTTSVAITIDYCPENCAINISLNKISCLTDGTYRTELNIVATQRMSHQLFVNLDDRYFDTLDTAIDSADFILNPCLPGLGSPVFISVTDLFSGGLIVSEILADPHEILGDANRDGTVDASDDEFIEIYNHYGFPIDLSGYTMSDISAIRHLFPDSTIINPYGTLVIFGGGLPDSDSINGSVQIASEGSLSLNNTGDQIVLKTPGDHEVWQLSYGSQGGQNQSLVNLGADLFIPIGDTLVGTYQNPGMVHRSWYGVGEGILGIVCSDTVWFSEPICPVLDTFDLALRLTQQEEGPYRDGDTVLFHAEIFNQGNITAFAIRAFDYIPPGLVFYPQLNNIFWESDAVSRPVDSLPPLTSFCLPISLVVSAPAMSSDNDYENAAEIIYGQTKKGLEGQDTDGLLSILGGGEEEINDVLNDNYYSKSQDDFDFERMIHCQDIAVDVPEVVDILLCGGEDDADSVRITPKAVQFSTDLFISEYMEGNAFNKCLEIFNWTGKEIALDGYIVEVYVNGSEQAGFKSSLQGKLSHGDTYLICHDKADSVIRAQADLLTGTISNFNGDDVIVLRKSSRVIDAIGQISYEGIFAMNTSLIRLPEVLNGDPNPYDTFLPEEEWIVIHPWQSADLNNHLIQPAEVKSFNFYQAADRQQDVLVCERCPSFVVPSPGPGIQNFIKVRSVVGSCESQEMTMAVATHAEQADLACVGKINLHVGRGCSVEVSAAEVLLSPYFPEFFEIMLIDHEGSQLDGSDLIGRDSAFYRLIDNCTGNTCTGKILLERIPDVQISDCACTADSVNAENDCRYYVYDNIHLDEPQFSFACSQDLMDTIPVMKRIKIEQSDCQETTERTDWIFTGPDGKANDTLCSQLIVWTPPSLDSLRYPLKDILLSCEDLASSLDPAQLEEVYPILWTQPYFINNTGDTIGITKISEGFLGWEYYDQSNDEFDHLILRTWRITDWCTGRVSEFVQTLQFNDDIAPDFNLISIGMDDVSIDQETIDSLSAISVDFEKLFHLIEITDALKCEADFEIPHFDKLADNCTSIDDLIYEYGIPPGTVLDTTEGRRIQGLTRGTHFIEIIVTDQMGNSSSVTLVVVVLDKTRPQMICRDAVRINLIAQPGYLDGGVARIPLEVFDRGSFDSCGEIIFRLGRRLDNNFFCGKDLLTFIGREYLEFCCEDAGKAIPVEYRIYDAYGNQSVCELEVFVEDVSIPTLDCPDLIIECGTMDSIFSPSIAGGVCHLEADYIFLDSILATSPCGESVIYRTWTDRRSGESCRQRIVHRPYPAFDPGVIRWPVHRTGKIYDLNTDQAREMVVLLKDTAGHQIELAAYDFAGSIYDTAGWRPYRVLMNDPLDCLASIPDTLVIGEERCSLTGVSYRDKTFHSGRSDLRQTLRSWTFIDWCLVDPDAPYRNQSKDYFQLVDNWIDNTQYFRLDTTRSILDGIYQFDQIFYFDCTDFWMSDKKWASGQLRAHVTGDQTKYLGAYPNPFSSRISLGLQAIEKGIIHIDITGSSGILISKSIQQVYKGTNKLVLDEGNFGNSGIYYLRITLGEQTWFDVVVRI